jgi:hypothetical protein
MYEASYLSFNLPLELNHLHHRHPKHPLNICYAQSHRPLFSSAFAILTLSLGEIGYTAQNSCNDGDLLS